MRLYEVTLENQTIHFIAENMDHLITLVSQTVNTTDYGALLKAMTVKQVAGNQSSDGIDFYRGLIG